MKAETLIPRSVTFNRAGAEVTRLPSIVRIFALACLLAAGPAMAQVNYTLSGNTAYVVSGCGDNIVNQTIVVEARADLLNWQPIWTNTMPGASADFVDPKWLNHPGRFYRARSE